MSMVTGEHEFEAAHGLPEPLPAGERILWQGAPDWRALAVRAFHVRKLFVYFAVIIVLRGVMVFAEGTAREALIAGLWMTALAATAIGIALVMAWLSASTTAYTLTDKRLVMRIGIVLTVTFNLPLRWIERADLRAGAGGTGDIPFTLKAPNRIAYLHLWPHARPWSLARPQPMLRAIPAAAQVAQTFAAAWSEANGLPVAPQPATAMEPRRGGDPRPVMVAN